MYMVYRVTAADGAAACLEDTDGMGLYSSWVAIIPPLSLLYVLCLNGLE